MTFISTAKKKAQHNQTPRDIYYTALEEAYGNLPVPSDDYADIRKLLQKYLADKKTPNQIEYHFQKLEEAIDTISEHYEYVAKALDKHQSYA
jgi:hypothetical protein